MKKSIVYVIVLLFLCTGCDSVYHYVVYPPGRIEYTLVPDYEMIAALGDSSYKVGRDSATLIYDKKDYKIELKYLTDYQLNTFDFPDVSVGRELSGNPYTYGDWVDPKLGYTPNRFTNYKLVMYNYSSSKININPELSLIETDRGDIIFPYGRERLKSKYKSYEEYFQRLKGMAGSDEDLYDNRMGLVRRTSFIYSRPLFAGDSRDGIVSYDPLDQSVQKIKLTYENIVMGYDENNQPSKFINVIFYFKRVPLVTKTSAAPAQTAQVQETKKEPAKGTGSYKKLISTGLNIKLLQYQFLPSARIDPRETKYWDPLPLAFPKMVENLSKETGIKCTFAKMIPEDLGNDAHILTIIFGVEQPVFTTVMMTNISEAVRKGAFLYLDDGYEKKDRGYPYENFMRDFLEKIGTTLNVSYKIEQIPMTHTLYGDLMKNAGTDNSASAAASSITMLGLYAQNELVGVGVINSLYQKWEGSSNLVPELRDEALRIGRNILIFGGSRKISK